MTLAEAVAKKFEVFLSYSSDDEAVARALYEQLRDREVTCWWAPTSIRTGDDYTSAIIRGLNESRSMVLLLSPASNASEDVRIEIDLAKKRKLPTLPVLIHPVPAGTISPRIEYLLASRQFYDATSGGIHAHAEQIVRDIRLYTGGTPEATPPSRTDSPPPASADSADLGGPTTWPDVSRHFIACLHERAVSVLGFEPWYTSEVDEESYGKPIFYAHATQKHLVQVWFDRKHKIKVDLVLGFYSENEVRDPIYRDARRGIMEELDSPLEGGWELEEPDSCVLGLEARRRVTLSELNSRALLEDVLAGLEDLSVRVAENLDGAVPRR